MPVWWVNWLLHVSDSGEGAQHMRAGRSLASRLWPSRTGQFLMHKLACMICSAVVLLVLNDGPLSARGLIGLHLEDVAFTQRVVNRQPADRLTSFAMGNTGSTARLYFWLMAGCADQCLDHLQSDEKIPVTLYWYLDTGPIPILKDRIPLTVEGTEWRTWGFKENLKPGTWRVEVRSEDVKLCRLDKACLFTIEVKSR